MEVLAGRNSSSCVPFSSKPCCGRNSVILILNGSLEGFRRGSGVGKRPSEVFLLLLNLALAFFGVLGPAHTQKLASSFESQFGMESWDSDPS